MWQNRIYRDELVFSCSDKFLIREKSDCIQKSWDTNSSGETRKQDESKLRIRRSVEFSSAAERCTPWRVDGHSHGENLPLQKRNQGMWTIPNLKPEVFKKKQSWRDPLLVKRLRRNPMHPVNQLAREDQKLKRWNSSHNSSYGSSILDRHGNLRTRTSMTP